MHPSSLDYLKPRYNDDGFKGKILYGMCMCMHVCACLCGVLLSAMSDSFVIRPARIERLHHGIRNTLATMLWENQHSNTILN